MHQLESIVNAIHGFSGVHARWIQTHSAPYKFVITPQPANWKICSNVHSSTDNLVFLNVAQKRKILIFLNFNPETSMYLTSKWKFLGAFESVFVVASWLSHCLSVKANENLHNRLDGFLQTVSVTCCAVERINKLHLNIYFYFWIPKRWIIMNLTAS